VGKIIAESYQSTLQELQQVKTEKAQYEEFFLNGLQQETKQQLRLRANGRRNGVRMQFICQIQKHSNLTKNTNLT
jgi:hypothetical protein